MNVLRPLVSPAVLAVGDSLRTDPKSWVPEGEYHIVHVTGIKVWTGNDAYGLEINGGESGRWGGVSFLSSFGLSLSHWWLSFALRGWRNRSGQSIASRLRAGAAL